MDNRNTSNNIFSIQRHIYYDATISDRAFNHSCRKINVGNIFTNIICIVHNDARNKLMYK